MVTKPKVELMHFTPIDVADKAIGQCWGKGCLTGDALKERMSRVANKFKHASTIEHLSYNFHISNISRALLQELARHRISSFSVKSTRYTLKTLKDEERFVDEENKWEDIAFNGGEIFDTLWERVSNYLVLTGDKRADSCSVIALQHTQDMLNQGLSNDVAKYCLPESYKTELVWSINARSLQNFLELRTNKAALREIRNLAYEIFNQLPEEHKFLFENNMYREKLIKDNDVK